MVAPIRLETVSARLGRRLVLEAVSLQADKGELIGLIGPNGAGKSSLLRVMAGLLMPDSGDVRIGGELISDIAYRARATQLAYLPQARPVAWSIMAEDLVALGRFALGAGSYAQCGEADRLAVDAALMKAGASAYKGRHVHELSGGEKARLHLARVLASPASVILLDEPLAALDIKQQLDVMAVLQSECQIGRTVIVALHDLSLAQRMCDRLIVLKHGKVIIDDAPTAALSAPVLGDVFGVALLDGQFVSQD